jgi:hypothetical protein
MVGTCPSHFDHGVEAIMAESQQPPSQVSRVADENAMGKPIEVFWMTLADASMFQKFTVVHVFDHGCVLSHR